MMFQALRILRSAAVLCTAFLFCTPVMAEQRIETVSGDGLFRVTVANATEFAYFGVQSADPFGRWVVDKPVSAIALNGWGGVLYVGYEDGSIEARETDSLRLLWFAPSFNTRIAQLVEKDGEVLAVDSDGSALLYNARNGTKLDDSPGDLPVALAEPPVSANLTASQVSIGARDGSSRIFDRGFRQWTTQLRTIEIPAQTRTITVTPDSGQAQQPVIVTAPNDDETIAPGAPDAIVSYSRRSVDLEPLAESASLEPAPPPAPATSEFPWPPPPPSDRYDVFGRDLHAAGLFTYDAVDRMIRDALNRADYRQPNYYLIDNGFVMVTRLETIHPDGRPLAGTARWGMTPPGTSGSFGLADIIRGLFTAPTGHYRVIAFALNRQLEYDETLAEVTPEQAEGWLLGGTASLDETLRQRLVDPWKDQLNILIYEFVKPNRYDSAYLTRDRLTAREHLTAANLREALP